MRGSKGLKRNSKRVWGRCGVAGDTIVAGMTRHPCGTAGCATRVLPVTMRPLPEPFVKSPDVHQLYPHPARLILILSLAPTVGLGVGRFAYALVLPDMRDSLAWSYSAAGFMNTINAA